MNLHKEMVYAEIKDYAFITLGLLLYTFAWTVFLLPYQIVTGGVTGISALIFFATKDTLLFTPMCLLTPHFLWLRSLSWALNSWQRPSMQSLYSVSSLVLPSKW